MIDIVHLLEERLRTAFATLGYDTKLATMQKSSRPDLGDFQCNAAMKIAGMTKQKPIDVANKILTAMQNENVFSNISIAGPGFVNFTLSSQYLAERVTQIRETNEQSLASFESKRIVLDYGGPNVAKPLHVGHLRSAIVGDSLKRIMKYLGHQVVSDVHLGDWGTPMGMLLAAMQEEYPRWPYFTGSPPYPATSPITVEDLNALYPRASERFKTDPVFANRAREATVKLQNGDPGYIALWKQFVKISTDSVKSDYDRLGISFDLWLGESDSAKYVSEVEDIFKTKSLLVESQGAQVIEVGQASDRKPVPPLIFKKEDGGLTYATTDLATIFMRKTTISPDKILYIVDQRQSLHFEQVFRAAINGGLAADGSLEHIGFGTLNGADGKPFKTRQGGVMRLSFLIDLATDEVVKRVYNTTDIPSNIPPDIQEMIEDICVAAIKFGDLSIQRQADYAFDIGSFVQTEGKTGPYLQYAAVRVKSLLRKAGINIGVQAPVIIAAPEERDLVITMTGFLGAIKSAFDKRMPSEICDFAYSLATSFNRFYNACPILSAPTELEKMSRLVLAQTTLQLLEKSLDLLGIKVPPKMISFTLENEHGGSGLAPSLSSQTNLGGVPSKCT